MTSQQPEPTVITLDAQNSAQILTQYVELAQQKGAFLLPEAELLKRASDVLLNKVPDAEINVTAAYSLLVQGVQKGQRHGAYTLNDASLLSKVVQFVGSQSDNLASSLPTPSSPPTPSQPQNDFDLSDLSDPIPLKPKEI